MRALNYPNSRQAIIRSQLGTCRKTLFDLSFPEVLGLIDPNLRKEWANPASTKVKVNRSDLTVTFSNGSVIIFLGLDEGRFENILGDQFVTIYMNECSQIHSYKMISDLMGRLAQNVKNKDGKRAEPKFLFDMNPPSKSHWSYRAFIQLVNPIDRTPWAEPDEWGAILMNPQDNNHLAEDFVSRLESTMTAQSRKRFLEGKFSEEVENALFKGEWIARNRVQSVDIESLKRIIVAVDPAVTSNKNSDETGIVVAGINHDGHVYILADRSLKATTQGWAIAVSQAYEDFNANEVVVETNQGGDLIKSSLSAINSFMPVKTVFHTKGKVVRAEPVSQQYETDKVSHVGEFQILEEQLESFSSDYNRSTQGSPDRLDALVIAVTALCVKPNNTKIAMGTIRGF